MHCLGIETTAHTFGVGIIDDKGKVLANVINAFSTKIGGMVPNKVAEHHVDVCDSVISDALKKAGLGMKDINLISYSDSPGLGHALKIGCMAAKGLALQNKIPLVGVNHCIAHLEIGRLLTQAKDPVLLYASGANTQIIAFEAGKYRIFGETLDIGVGNFLDSFARNLGLGFPGGPKIEQLALQSKKLIELPYIVKGMDVSFGGLLTNLKQKSDSGKYSKEDLSFSTQETVFAMLVEVSERAMAHCDKQELLLGGGVACNKRLQEMCKTMCKERNAQFFTPEKQFLVDNGAMIAWLGILMHNAGIDVEPEKATIHPYLRTDDIGVTWR
jgi:universal protein Kae1